MFKNNVPTTKRVLVKNLQNFSSFLYAHISEDNWVKHEESIASYADLRVAVEGFTIEADNNRNNYDIVINNVMESAGISSIKEMVTEMFHDFKGLSSSTPLSSATILIVTPPEANATVREGENSKKRVVVWQKPPSYTEGEPQPMVTRELKPKVAKDVEVAKVEKELADLEKEEKLERAAQEAKLIELNKHVLVKVVGEVDVELKVHQREYLAKVKKSNKLKKKRYNQYVWTTTNRLKPEKIIDTHIYPNIKPVAITVYKNNDQRNFEVYNPFKSLPKGIPFVNNKVIETPEHRIFFTDALDEQAFQRVSDIHKVEVETLLGYLVMAGNVNTPENQRFCVLLRQMIDAHPDREKLKSKKVKLEAIGYSFN
ncbi:hypothetical protein Tco_0510954 [Tanacetum coccineum]